MCAINPAHGRSISQPFGYLYTKQRYRYACQALLLLMSGDTILSKDDSDRGGSVNTYECEECGNRTEAKRSPGDCPGCGGSFRNISIPREQ